MPGIRVAVIGAGIAGLTVAAALAQSQHQCTVYEQAHQLTELGAGIQLSPNGSRLLHRLGLADALDAVAVRPSAIEMRGWHSNEVIARTDLGFACEAMFGAPYYTLRRADLHRILLSQVNDSVRLGHRCVALSEEADEVRLCFADGSRATADVVVGADGIHSAVRGHLVADDARFTGVTVYRGLVAAERLPRRRTDPKVLIWLGAGQHCVSYPVARGVSFVAVAPATGWRTESWTAPGNVADLAVAYAGWHEEVREMLASAESVTRWALHDRAALARWSTPRSTVVGDAAHAMLPFGAQGANQAVEDAMALAACLRGAGREEVPDALRRYERARVPRIARVSAAVRANARDHHLADGEGQESRDREMSGRRSLRQQEWLYGYDAERVVSQ